MMWQWDQAARPAQSKSLGWALLDSIVNGGNASSLGDSFGYISSLSYTLLTQAWRTKLAQGVTDSRNLSQTWIPQNLNLNGTQPRVYARLEIGGLQLIITVVSTVVLAIVSYAGMQGYADDHVDPIIRGGGVIDLFSLVADSKLPAMISGGAEEPADGRDGRRVRAERTPIAEVSNYSTIGTVLITAKPHAI